MIGEYIKALLLIFIAEMGDKTQILAMMFATRYKVTKVMLGICIGSFLNHGIAVVFGKYIGGKIPSHLLQMIAGAAFILFAIWTLSEDDEEDLIEEESQKNRGAVLTVAMAFFIGELGDKTQLTAITLSIDALYPFIILLGTVSGMILTSGIGIFVGAKMGDRIPDFLIKIISGTVFLIFGVQKLWQATPDQYITPLTVSVFTLSILVTVTLLMRSIIKARQAGKISAYKRVASHLHEYSKQIAESAKNICLGEGHCGLCKKGDCAIGYIKDLTNDLIKGDIIHDDKMLRDEIKFYKNKFDPVKLTYSLAVTIRFLFRYQEIENTKVDEIKRVLEMLLFDSIIPPQSNVTDYIKQVGSRNIEIKKLLVQDLNLLENIQSKKDV